MAMSPEMKAIAAIERAFQQLNEKRDRERVANWFSEKYAKPEVTQA